MYLARLMQSCQTVTILAGPDKVKLSCHKILLGFYSEFFRAACYGGFAEAANGEVEMPEDEPGVVGSYISWMLVYLVLTPKYIFRTASQLTSQF